MQLKGQRSQEVKVTINVKEKGRWTHANVKLLYLIGL